ncbi:MULTISPECIES: BRO family protein [Corynebacterium]|uniref:BRO-N domain-containing protein n=1 Tax=Corynebacterium TaxID=1716 RepID=UPI00124E968A|nr:MULTISPECIES: BRO family protein [Corynebacterium]
MELQKFDFKGHGVRVIADDPDNPQWVATDVAKVLGYGSAKDMARRLDEDEKGRRSVPTLGGEQQLTTVTESGLYTAIIGSKRPEAKDFKRWITHEVLPSIRKHGGYLTPSKVQEVLTDPDTIIQLATQLKDERARAEKAELEAKRSAQVINIQAPMVAKAAAHSAVEHAVGKQDFARQVQQYGYTRGVDIKQRDVLTLLARKGLLIKPGRADSGHITAQSVRSDRGWNKRGTTETGYEYVKPLITKKGQDLAWKWVYEAFETHGPHLNPEEAA